VSGAGALEAAEATDRALREQIADLVRARARADAEAARLAGRAGAGADPALDGIRERYERQAGRLAEEIESLRRDLRTHEPELERLRADATGA
jgi:predicted RNase H-like nuclease (RuvC/YqgF family)